MYDPLFVYVNAEHDIKLERYKARGEWYITPEEFEKLSNEYDKQLRLIKNTCGNRNFLELQNNFRHDIYNNIITINNYIKEMGTLNGVRKIS